MLRPLRIHSFHTLALLLLAGIALLATWSCGGQSGGAPSGIAGTLVNARLEISSFSLIAGGANTIIGAPSNPNIVGIQGALYPALSARSFRVTIQGASVDQSDVVFDIDLGGSGGTHGTVVGTLSLALATSPVDGQLYYYPVQKNAQGAWVWVDPKVTNPPTPGTVYATTADVYLSSVSAALRSGARNVIVQFYSDISSVAEVGDPFVPPAPSSVAYSNWIKYRAQNVTNIYVFSASIAPQKTAQGNVVDLSTGFASDNGTNGPIDSAKYNVQINSVPVDVQSIVIQGFQQPTGLDPTPLVFTKVVDRSISLGSGDGSDFDSNWPDNGQKTGLPGFSQAQVNVQSKVLMANQQQPIKLYVTAWSQPNGQGVLLGSTYEDGVDVTLAPPGSPVPPAGGSLFPIQFTPAPNANVGAGNAGNVLDSPSSYFFYMGLKPTLSNLQLLNGTVDLSLPDASGSATTLASVTSSTSYTPQFQATQTTYSFFAPGQTAPPLAPPTVVPIPNSLLSYQATSVVGGANNWPAAGAVYWIPTVGASASPGVVTGSITALQNLTSSTSTTGTVAWGGTSFSAQAYQSSATSTLFYKAAVGVFNATFNPGDGPPTPFTYAVPVTPNLGFLGGGTIN